MSSRKGVFGYSPKENRQILKAMVLKNLKGRYKNSYVGFAWNFLTPILLIAAIYLVFTSIKTVHVDRDFWIYLSVGVFMMTTCGYFLRGQTFQYNASYVKKMAIPRWVIIISDVISQYLVLVISYSVLIVLVYASGHTLDISFLLFFPLEMALLFVLFTGLCFLFSTLTVVVRDTANLMSIVGRVLLWLTPVFFYLQDANSLLHTVAMHNPFTYFVESFHYLFSYAKFPDMMFIQMSIVISFAFLAIGLLVYRHYEKRLAELL